MDADQALTHMQRDELGGYGLTVRRFGARKLFAAGATAQEAADAMERMMEAGKLSASPSSPPRYLLGATWRSIRSGKQ